MSWLSVSLVTDAAHAEAMADALSEVGALSATIEDDAAGTPEESPQFGEPGAETTLGWTRSRISALFAADATLDELIPQAAQAAGLPGAPTWSASPLDDQDWVRQTQAQFDPIRINERLWIVPSWHEAPDPSAVNIALDPGLAFGTGSHPTTRLCLEWLADHVTPEATVLDYGCGSGILAIAAARLGAARVVGNDIDPQAVEAARDNAERNGVDIRFQSVEARDASQYRIVVANILANPLRALAPALCAHVQPGGLLALSGILVEQAEELIDTYSPWISLSIAGTREGWVCLAGRKPGAGV